jgi:hypothetical protein
LLARRARGVLGRARSLLATAAEEPARGSPSSRRKEPFWTAQFPAGLRAMRFAAELASWAGGAKEILADRGVPEREFASAASALRASVSFSVTARSRSRVSAASSACFWVAIVACRRRRSSCSVSQAWKAIAASSTARRIPEISSVFRRGEVNGNSWPEKRASAVEFSVD